MTKNDERMTYKELQQKLLKFKEQGLTEIACNGGYDALHEEYRRVLADLESGTVTVAVSKIEVTNDEPDEQGNAVPRSPKPGKPGTDGEFSSDAIGDPPKNLSHFHFRYGRPVIPIRTNRHPAIVPVPRLGA